MTFTPLTEEEILDNKLSGFGLGSGWISNVEFFLEEKFLDDDLQWYKFINRNTGFVVFTVRTFRLKIWSKFSLNKEVV
jgi:hypothetical protein